MEPCECKYGGDLGSRVSNMDVYNIGICTDYIYVCCRLCGMRGPDARYNDPWEIWQSDEVRKPGFHRELWDRWRRGEAIVSQSTIDAAQDAATSRQRYAEIDDWHAQRGH